MENIIPKQSGDHTSPFRHLRPELWKKTKAPHITLTVIGTLHMLPACLVMYMLYGLMKYDATLIQNLEGEDLFYFIITIATTSAGVLTWVGLCLLFFQRTDARWQKAVWMVCAVYGCIATITMIIGITMLVDENALQHMDAWALIPFLMFLSALITAYYGIINYRLAAGTMSEPIEEIILPD